MGPILGIRESIKSRGLENVQIREMLHQNSCCLGHPNQLICRNESELPYLLVPGHHFLCGCAHPVRMSGPSVLEVRNHGRAEAEHGRILVS